MLNNLLSASSSHFPYLEPCDTLPLFKTDLLNLLCTWFHPVVILNFFTNLVNPFKKTFVCFLLNIFPAVVDLGEKGATTDGRGAINLYPSLDKLSLPGNCLTIAERHSKIKD